MERVTRYGLAMLAPSRLERTSRCSGGGGDHSVDADTSPCSSTRQRVSHARRFPHAQPELTIGA